MCGMVCHLNSNIIGPFLYRKSEAVVTNTDSRDSKPNEEKDGCIQENESDLS
jgi:hypothetical protein